MLCKVSNAAYNAPLIEFKTNTAQQNVASGGYVTLYTVTAPGNHRFEATGYANEGSNWWAFYKNDTQVWRIPYSGVEGAGDKTFSYTFYNCVVGDVLKMYSSQPLRPLHQGTIYRTSMAIYKTYAYKGKPRELKTIGNKARATIFGIHIDGSRVTQE